MARRCPRDELLDNSGDHTLRSSRHHRCNHFMGIDQIRRFGAETKSVSQKGGMDPPQTATAHRLTSASRLQRDAKGSQRHWISFNSKLRRGNWHGSVAGKHIIVSDIRHTFLCKLVQPRFVEAIPTLVEQCMPQRLPISQAKILLVPRSLT